MLEEIRIATRESPLALWQAEHVADLLRRRHPGVGVSLCPMTTKGDRILDRSLAKIGGKGLFIKELEQAMLAGEADIAVHSMKDVPAELPDGLELAAILAREDPRDALVSHRFDTLEALPDGARVGTSSLRRQSQLRHLRPDLEISPLRGNVGTRLRRLDEGTSDAIILAAAGLKRLGLAERIAGILDPDQCLPAVGQGAIGIECRSDDRDVIEALRPIACEQAAARVAAERGMSAGLEGSCQSPIAGFAVVSGDDIWLRGRVVSVDGREMVSGDLRGPARNARAVGEQLAESLLNRGAREILAALQE